MAHTFERFTGGALEAKEWLLREFSGIRTGRATPQILDSVTVDSYGSQVSLQQVASISVEDARSIRVSVWDKGQIKAVEKAISDANLGLSVVTDDKGLRVMFPELTSERREQLLKLAKSKLEETRVSIRKARDESMKEIDQKEKDGDMSEDEKFRAKAELQKHVDTVNGEIEALYNKKETEITS